MTANKYASDITAKFHFNESASLTAVIFSLFIIVLLTYPAVSESALLKGRAFDSSKSPMADVEIYAYSTKEVRRAADFISARTGRDGAYILHLPEGVFWVLARERREGDQRFGPLPSDRKHSGEPIRIESGNEDLELNFELMTLKESAEMKKADKSPLKSLKGYIRNKKGENITGGYAVAVRKSTNGGYEKFFSPSSNSDGYFEIKLPEGEYSVSPAIQFPPYETSSSKTITTENASELILEIE